MTTTQSPIETAFTIAVVDNDRWTLHALLSFLSLRLPEAQVAWTASSAAQASRLLLERPHPDVLLIDMALGAVGGVDLIADMRRRSSILPVVAMTAFPLEEYAAAASRAGAQSLVSKGEPMAMVDAIRQVAVGGVGDPVAGICFDDTMSASHRLLSDGTRKRQNCAGLSMRESELIELCSQGFTSKQIARMTGLSTATVNNHFQRICDRLGAANRIQMVSIFLKSPR